MLPVKKYNRVYTLIKHELRAEIRIRHTLGGLLLYLFSILFLLYIGIRSTDSPFFPAYWHTQFWMVTLFMAIFLAPKTFAYDNARQLYYYNILPPALVIIAKIIYNTVILIIVSLLTYVLFCLFLGNPIKAPWKFVGIIIISNMNLGTILTFIAAIASKAQQTSMLMTVLGIPMITPIFIIIFKLSHPLLVDGYSIEYNPLMLILCIMNLIIFTIAYILFPYLWKN